MKNEKESSYLFVVFVVVCCCFVLLLIFRFLLVDLFLINSLLLNLYVFGSLFIMQPYAVTTDQRLSVIAEHQKSCYAALCSYHRPTSVRHR